MGSLPLDHPDHIRRRGLTRDRIETGLKGKVISGVTSQVDIIYINFADGSNLSIKAIAERGPAQLLFQNEDQEWIDD